MEAQPNILLNYKEKGLAELLRFVKCDTQTDKQMLLTFDEDLVIYECLLVVYSTCSCFHQTKDEHKLMNPDKYLETSCHINWMFSSILMDKVTF